MHVLGGDSGSALAQFVFGLLLAWYGATAPFIVSFVTAGIVAVFALVSSARGRSKGLQGVAS